jgi:alpha-tubulin suppressor-like RCC1 family protein
MFTIHQLPALVCCGAAMLTAACSFLDVVNVRRALVSVDEDGPGGSRSTGGGEGGWTTVTTSTATGGAGGVVAKPLPDGGVVEMAVGHRHACAVFETGVLRCWGANESGQLGIGSRDDFGDEQTEVAGAWPVVDLEGDIAIAVAVGGAHSCAILSDGAVVCWGKNNAGQLGLGDTNDRGGQPGQMGGDLPRVDLGPERRATAIALGQTHSCVILDNGKVACWGNNHVRQLGISHEGSRGDGPNEMGSELDTVYLGGEHTAKAITAGYNHTCAICDEGDVKCWGSNSAGELGQGGPGNGGGSPTLVGLGKDVEVVSISAGDRYTCALGGDADHLGQIKCWGNNPSGALGAGLPSGKKIGNNPDEMGEYLDTVKLGDGSRAVSVSAGGRHTCALLDDNTVKCWGNNDLGSLGIGPSAKAEVGTTPGDMGDNLAVTPLGSGHPEVARIDVGHDHSCALFAEGAVKCWGRNDRGQLGLGDTKHRGDGADEMGDDLPLLPFQ